MGKSIFWRGWRMVLRWHSDFGCMLFSSGQKIKGDLMCLNAVSNLKISSRPTFGGCAKRCLDDETAIAI